MQIWRRGMLYLSIMFLLLLLVGGAGRLIGREETAPAECSAVRETVLATPVSGDTGQRHFARSFRSSFERHEVVTPVPVQFVLPEIRTDANGTVIAGRRSYLHLRYQAFSLSDGFV